MIQSDYSCYVPHLYDNTIKSLNILWKTYLTCVFFVCFSVILLQMCLLTLTWALSQSKVLGFTPADSVATMFCSTHKSLTLGMYKESLYTNRRHSSPCQNEASHIWSFSFTFITKVPLGKHHMVALYRVIDALRTQGVVRRTTHFICLIRSASWKEALCRKKLHFRQLAVCV